MREVVEEQVAPLISEAARSTFGDFTKIPVMIVAELLGVPEERHDDFRRWSNDITSNSSSATSSEVRRVMDRAIADSTRTSTSRSSATGASSPTT